MSSQPFTTCVGGSASYGPVVVSSVTVFVIVVVASSPPKQPPIARETITPIAVVRTAPSGNRNSPERNMAEATPKPSLPRQTFASTEPVDQFFVQAFGFTAQVRHDVVKHALVLFVQPLAIQCAAKNTWHLHLLENRFEEALRALVLWFILCLQEGLGRVEAFDDDLEPVEG